jgi:hypothetical protein
MHPHDYLSRPPVRAAQHKLHYHDDGASQRARRLRVLTLARRVFALGLPVAAQANRPRWTAVFALERLGPRVLRASHADIDSTPRAAAREDSRGAIDWHRSKCTSSSEREQRPDCLCHSRRQCDRAAAVTADWRKRERITQRRQRRANTTGRLAWRGDGPRRA